MSEGLMWGVGLFLAIFGPLFLLPVVWLVHRWPLGALDRWWAARRGRRLGWKRQALAFALVGGVVLASWLPGYLRYGELCAAHATPRIAERVRVEGFFHARMFAYEAERYLGEWGFSWVEAPDPYRAGRLLRYRRDASGTTVSEEIATPAAEYAVVADFSELAGGTSLSTRRVFRLPAGAEAWRDPAARGAEIGRAGSVVYQGGPLRWVLGAWGMTNCPSPRSAEGGARFMDFYELEKRVLRGG